MPTEGSSQAYVCVFGVIAEGAFLFHRKLHPVPGHILLYTKTKSNCTAGTRNDTANISRHHSADILLEKKAGGGAPCSRAGGITIAMGIRVFGVRGSKGTSTEQGVFVAIGITF